MTGPEPVVDPAKRTTCPNCGSTALSWQVAVITTDHAPVSGRMALNDVKAVGVLGCDECSETVAVIDEDALAALLNEPVQ